MKYNCWGKEKKGCFLGAGLTKNVNLIMKVNVPYSLIFVSFVGLFMLGSESLLFGQRLRILECQVQGIGIFSSPRVTDLNGDGIGDIVFGAGRTEFHACDSPSSR